MKFGQWLGFFCLVVSLVILWQFRQSLLLFFAAIVIATALNRLVLRLQKSRLKRGSAVMLTLSIVFVVTALVILLIVPPFIEQFLELVRLVPTGASRVFDQLELLIDRLPPWFPNVEVPSFDNAGELQPLIRNLLTNAFDFLTNSFSALINSLIAPLQLLFVLVLAIMLLVNPQAYRRVFLLLFPSFYRRRADDILNRCEVDLGNWLGGVVVSSACIAALSGIGLWILGIPLVLAQALLAGLLNFIPNIGPTLSVIFPITVALLDAPWKAIAVLILYVVIQQLESYWITPTIMASQVSLLPALTLVAQIFFASFFGFVGLLLALPLAVVVRAWIEEALIKDVLNKWGGDKSPSPSSTLGAPAMVMETVPDSDTAPPEEQVVDAEDAPKYPKRR